MDGITADSYRVTEAPLGTRRHLRVLMIGAGASGLCLARQMELNMDNFELTIYDKNSGVGGTWFENRYPGCGCDIPSHSYQFTWEPNPNWSKYYSPGDEILNYFTEIAQKYELYKYIKLRHKVEQAVWDDTSGFWNVEVSDLDQGVIFKDWAHVVINGSGILNNWKLPDIPGIESFRGDLFHTANWDPDYTVQGKKVAVIGMGSSGIQILPAIQPKVESLTTFIRSPTWITAGFAQRYAGPGGSNFSYTDEQKSIFTKRPEEYLKYRKEIESELNSRFKFIIVSSQEQQDARKFSHEQMASKLNGASFTDKLIPKDFAIGCRRPTPGIGFLEALTKDNVRVVTDTIESTIPEGIRLKTSEVIELDTLVCATGFDLSFRPRFKLFGRNGADIHERWKYTAQAYLSVAVPDFPNYFLFLGPNAPAGHGSIIPIIEHVTKYLINMMKKLQTQNIKAVSPKPEATSDFQEHISNFMKRTAWATPCRSWFKGGKVDGPVVALHPGSRIHWFHMMENIRFEDWNYDYLSGNRFQYLGNGFSAREGPGLDTTWYFDHPNDGYKDY